MDAARFGSRFFGRVFIFLLCILGGAAWAFPKHWTVIDIKGPGAGAGLYSSAYAVALNDSGQVLVYSPGAAGIGDKTFLWDNGNLVDFGVVPAAEPWEDNRFLVARDVNDRGEVAGTFHGNLWSWKDGAWTDHEIQGDEVVAINKRGHILFVASSGETALLHDGVVTELGDLGGNVESAAINDRDQVVGNAQTAGGTTHAFLWAKGVMADLTPGTSTCGEPYSSGALDINQSGHVLGYVSDPCSGTGNYFLFHDRHLESLSVPAGAELIALDIRGDLIGETFNSDSSLDCAFVLSHGKSTCLNELPDLAAAGLSLSELVDINDHGWIIGTAFGARQVAHTVLFIPSP